jgi:hypothetical protein
MVLPITAFLRINGRWNPEKPGFNPDYYRYKSEVRSLIPQNARCVVGNESAFAALLYYIDRKGWAYTKDQLDSNKLVFCRENGAEYLFLDLPVEDFSGLEEQIQAKIAVKGSIQIYKLKPIP